MAKTKRTTCAQLEAILKAALQGQAQVNQQVSQGLGDLASKYTGLKQAYDALASGSGRPQDRFEECPRLVSLGNLTADKAKIRVVSGSVVCGQHDEGPCRDYSVCRLTMKDGQPETASTCPYSSGRSYLQWVWGEDKP